MTFAAAYTTADIRDAQHMIEADLPIIEKVRLGRKAALAALRTEQAEGENVVSLFNTGKPQRRTETPVFHTRRVRQVTVEAKPEPLLLTNPVAA